MAMSTAKMPMPRVSPEMRINRRRRAWIRNAAGSSGVSSGSAAIDFCLAGRAVGRYLGGMNSTEDMAGDLVPQRILVPASAAGSRLDAFIAGGLPELSRTRAKALIIAG